MDRTLRAALLAALITFGFIAGFGIFLQFPVVGSLVAGTALAVLAAALILLAARRAETFERPTPPTPGFPGPPDPAPDDDAR
ncbi:hypothetical protein FTX61_07425 [Nitriliruptoraceae bacterium ZYF776]|nr:hypothetical protein [Profundirhabdus halotolerans]